MGLTGIHPLEYELWECKDCAFFPFGISSGQHKVNNQQKNFMSHVPIKQKKTILLSTFLMHFSGHHLYAEVLKIRLNIGLFLTLPILQVIFNIKAALPFLAIQHQLGIPHLQV